MLIPLTVSALNAQIKSLLEATFLEVCVEGEIGNLTVHKASGHIYFSIKDATSSVRCVMFKGNAKALRFTPAIGMHIMIKGALSVYAPRGEYQVLCHSLNKSGQGSLSEQYEALKKKLESKGYFASASKKPLPTFPKKIALLTSLSGAALHDMKQVATKRWNLTKLVAFDTLTQGANAKDSIARNIAYVDSLYGSDEGFDIIVIARGGGSMEDLWGFNEECVADAIFAARTPIVSAVGHEVDVLISDFVADMRAPTPSACMEMILPDKKEWLLRLDELCDVYEHSAQAALKRSESTLDALIQLYQHINYEYILKSYATHIKQLAFALDASLRHVLATYSHTLITLHTQYSEYPLFANQEHLLHTLEAQLHAMHPKRLLPRHHAQILRDEVPVSLEQVRIDEEISLCDGSHIARAKILSLTQSLSC